MLEEIIADYERRIKVEQSVLDADGNIFSHDQRIAALSAIPTLRIRLETVKVAQNLLRADHPLLMHAKRRSVYAEVGVAIAQTDFHIQDDDELVLYRDVENGKWFVRSPSEMNDGRFLPVVRGPDGLYELEVNASPQEQKQFAAVSAPEVKGIRVTLKSPDDDDRVRFLSTEEMNDVIRTRRLHLTEQSDPNDEDMWGTWYVYTVSGNLPGPLVFQIKRT